MNLLFILEYFIFLIHKIDYNILGNKPDFQYIMDFNASFN